MNREVIRFRKLFGLALALVAWFGLFAIQPVLAGSIKQYHSPTPPRTSTPVPTSTPTATPTSTPWVPRPFDPRTVSMIVYGGGGGPICPRSSTNNRNLILKQYSAEFIPGLEFMGSTGMICVYGFPAGEPVTITLYAPDNRIAARLSAEPEPLIPEVLETGFYRSLSLPQGRWRFVAQSSTKSAEGSFWVGGADGLLLTASHEVDSTVIHPRDPRFFAPYSIGDILVIKGVAFRPNTDIPLGLYTISTTTSMTPLWKPIMGEWVRTDSSGAFTLAFPLDKRFQPGEYVAIPLIDPNRRSYPIVARDQARFSVIAPRRVCNPAYPSRIKVNTLVRLSAGLPNNVRQDPGYSGRYLGQIFAYQDALVLAGPECKDGLVWWKIRTEDNKLTGWTAEGSLREYWLVPLE